MISVEKRIKNLEYNIAAAKRAAQYSEGRDLLEELRRIAEMESRLAALKKSVGEVAK